MTELGRELYNVIKGFGFESNYCKYSGNLTFDYSEYISKKYEIDEFINKVSNLDMYYDIVACKSDCDIYDLEELDSLFSDSELEDMTILVYDVTLL